MPGITNQVNQKWLITKLKHQNKCKYGSRSPKELYNKELVPKNYTKNNDTLILKNIINFKTIKSIITGQYGAELQIMY